MNRKLELKLLSKFQNLEDHLSLLFLYISDTQAGFQHIGSQKDQFTVFFNICMKQIDKVYFLKNGTNPQQFKGECVFCSSRLESSLQLIVHLLLFHRIKISYKFTYYTHDKVLHISFFRQQPKQSPNSFKYAKVIDARQLECYLFLNLFSVSNAEFHQKNKLPPGQDQQITSILGQKQFFCGPAKNFKPITTIEEFKEKELIDFESYKKNELQCLVKSTPEFKDTPIQEFMILYNTKVLEQRPINMKEFLKQFTNLQGDLSICFQNHLFTMLCYNLIDQSTFVELSLMIQK